MEQWNEIATWQNWPDWRDAGKTVVFEREDGSIASGELTVDAVFDGEGEVPMFAIECEGVEISLHAIKRWRYA